MLPGCFLCSELTVERVQAFIPQLLSRLYMEMLVYGNVTKDVRTYVSISYSHLHVYSAGDSGDEIIP